MVTRIVKLSFAKENEEAFLKLFHLQNAHIRAMEGCLHLEALRTEAEKSVIYFTYSKWTSILDLDAYRSSSLFGEIWPKTKALFNDKPEVWTLTAVDTD
ncbi:MAG: putative quinol monooxygenase [Bacteroidota bacterium]